MPLSSSVVGQMMARFRNFYSLEKCQYLVEKGAKRRNTFRTGAEIHLSEKNGVVRTLDILMRAHRIACALIFNSFQRRV